jgi:predicted ArsR family transcriptional regulator
MQRRTIKYEQNQHQRMEWTNLNSRQRDILVTLAQDQPRNANQLESTLEVDRSTALRNLETLRSAGLVRGEKDTNSRGHPIQNWLTREGQRVVYEGVVETAEDIMDAEITANE